MKTLWNCAVWIGKVVVLACIGASVCGYSVLAWLYL